MSSQNITFEDMISSFTKVCGYLESNAQREISKLEKECYDEFNSGAKSLNVFNSLVAGINETYAELMNVNEILKSTSERAGQENVLRVPYDIQSDLVKCVNDLYGQGVVGRDEGKTTLLSDENKTLIGKIIRTCDKNLTEIKDVERTSQLVKGALS